MHPSKRSTSPATSSRRKPSKRYLVTSDDDDGDDGLPASRTKRARTADSESSLSDVDDGMDIDVGDSRFLPEDDLARDRFTTAKKKHGVYSDDEENESQNSIENELGDPEPDEDDDEFGHDTPAPRNKGKSKDGKGKPGQKTGKTKSGKEKEKEIVVKDERKLTTTSRGSSAAAQSQPSDLFSNDDIAPSSIADGPGVAKKRKLPPIKKTKTAGGATGTPTAGTTTQKVPPPPPPPSTVQDVGKVSLTTSEQRKQALTGVRDVDLGNSQVYAELFKGAGGSTPKSGLKNAEVRRKELDKMREEGRARRAEEGKHTFDLQSQADKIARFEQRLRAENSTVLHPNFLAAKFRDDWELDRRNRRGTPKEEGEA